MRRQDIAIDHHTVLLHGDDPPANYSQFRALPLRPTRRWLWCSWRSDRLRGLRDWRPWLLPRELVGNDSNQRDDDEGAELHGFVSVCGHFIVLLLGLALLL